MADSTTDTWLDTYQGYQQQRADMERAITDEFLEICARANGAEPFGYEMVRDYAAPRKFGDPIPERRQTLADVLMGDMDQKDFLQRCAQIVLSAAAGRGTQREAQQLLNDVAAERAVWLAEKAL